MNYTKDAIKGISWLGSFRVLFRSLSFIKLAILARLLSPAQFGIADIAILALALVEVLSETGINVFLIQKKEDIEDYIDTAWIISIFRGICISVILFISASMVASFFRSEKSYYLLLMVSLVPLIRGFINPSVIKFLKNLDYDKQFFYRSSIVLIEIFTTIIIVWITNDPTGIIWGLVVGGIWEVILTFVFINPRPKFTFDKTKFFEIIHGGKWLTLAGIFDYLYLNLDNIVIGRLLGASNLGLYMRAYGISLLPITEISDVFNQTTFPIYVKIHTEKSRLYKAFLKTLSTVSILVIPAGLLFFLFPNNLIILILGEKWLPAAPVLQVLALYGIIRAITRTTIGLFYSLKRQDIITRITGVNLLGLSLTIIPFINKWGVIGAGFSALIGTLISVPFVIYYVNKVLKED